MKLLANFVFNPNYWLLNLAGSTRNIYCNANYHTQYQFIRKLTKMLSRTLSRLLFRYSAHKEVNTAEIIAKMHHLRQDIKNEEQQLEELRKQVKQKEHDTNEKNKLIHQKRVRLTEDFKKAEQMWIDAKKKSQANKSAIIREFAGSLIELGNHFGKTKQLQTEQHSVDLREGFDNTVRLFFNTLEKFKIKKMELAEGSKVKKDQVDIVEQQKAESAQQKDTIAKIVAQGWQIEGKVLVKPKVIIYN